MDANGQQKTIASAPIIILTEKSNMDKNAYKTFYSGNIVLPKELADKMKSFETIEDFFNSLNEQERKIFSEAHNAFDQVFSKQLNISNIIFSTDSENYKKTQEEDFVAILSEFNDENQ